MLTPECNTYKVWSLESAVMKKEALWVFVVVWNIACLYGSRGCWEQEKVALLALNVTLDPTYGMYAGGSYFDCCSWEGGFSNLMELDISDNTVDVVAIAEGGFSNLKELGISGNLVDVVAIVEGIKNLNHLENLYLDRVHLKDVGTIMRALGALSSLKILSLQHNTIEGTITTQDFRNFSKLEQLILDYSSLNTTMGILSSLGPLTSLRLLSSYSIDLSGKLSDQSLCNLIKLEELYLSINGITGRLPTCWRNMTSIRVLFLEDNEFTNNIASSLLTSLTSLELLSISGNYFDIPSSLGPLANYSRLKVLLLDDNNLTTDSKVGSSISRFQLIVFSVSNSLSKGFNVTSLGFLNHQYDLRTIDLSSNDIAGPFPAWLLENNTKLEHLLMENNLFATLEVPLMTLRNLSVIGHVQQPHERRAHN
ncbi:hypothetical protein ACJRO7_016649 [Eucalyptus globulus]|uniref:Uncharacterized protein n=1 Tax=Eucalyptus globulus TaxID=34317 RepID=A0ABD3L8V2_EUCGL